MLSRNLPCFIQYIMPFVLFNFSDLFHSHASTVQCVTILEEYWLCLVSLLGSAGHMAEDLLNSVLRTPIRELTARGLKVTGAVLGRQR